MDAGTGLHQFRTSSAGLAHGGSLRASGKAPVAAGGIQRFTLQPTFSGGTSAPSPIGFSTLFLKALEGARMSDNLKQASEMPESFVPLGALPPGTKWPVIKRGMSRAYPEPDWIVWFQRARVYTSEAACLSMGWCPTEWANWHQSVPSTAQIREIARPYLDMLAKRADIFGNHPDAIVTVGEGGEKMIDLTSARRIAHAEGWDMPAEFDLPPLFVAEVLPVSPVAALAQMTAKGITKGEVLTAFAALMKPFDLKKALGNGTGLFGNDGARTQKGSRGGKHVALWNPVILAVGLNEKYAVPMLHLKNAFCDHSFLRKWADEWSAALDFLDE